MAERKTVLAVVLIAVIVVALIWIVSRFAPKHTGGGSLRGPQETTYYCAACGAEVKLSADAFAALPADPDTGYRKCPKCGAMGLNDGMVCAGCGKMISEPPKGTRDADYICPRCGKHALTGR